MTIHVDVTDYAISDSGVAIYFVTTNTEHPGEEETFGRVFADGTSQAEIKTAVDAATTLYWLAREIEAWEV